MKIQYTKTTSSKKRSRNSAMQQALEGENFQTPLKKVKLNKLGSSEYSLNNAEKSFIYLYSHVFHSEPKAIANTLERDKRTVESFIKSVSSTESFTGNHNKKGRWKKGSLQERSRSG